MARDLYNTRVDDPTASDANVESSTKADYRRKDNEDTQLNR